MSTGYLDNGKRMKAQVLRCPHCGGDLRKFVSELEERRLREHGRKVKAGIDAARANGVSWGAELKLDAKGRERLLAAVEADPDKSLAEIAKKHGVSRVTLWRYMRAAGYGA